MQAQQPTTHTARQPLTRALCRLADFDECATESDALCVQWDFLGGEKTTTIQVPRAQDCNWCQRGLPIWAQAAQATEKWQIFETGNLLYEEQGRILELHFVTTFKDLPRIQVSRCRGVRISLARGVVIARLGLFA